MGHGRRLQAHPRLGMSRPLVSLLPIAAISLDGQVQSRPSSCVRSPGRFADAVVLRPQTDLTGPARPWTISQREQGHRPQG